MPRLGELLVAAGVLTADQVDRALRAQVMWGARLGTNLIELGFIDLDTLSSFLGQQHKQPAALARHFEKVDRDLQRLLHPDLAEMYTCVPLARLANKDVVIASSTPLTRKATARIADELAIEPEQLIGAIAAELRIRYQLERVYNIARPARFMRSPGQTIPPFPQFQLDADEGALADEDLLEIVAAVPLDVRTTTPYLTALKPPGPVPTVDEDLSIDVDLSEPTPPPIPPRAKTPPRVIAKTELARAAHAERTSAEVMRSATQVDDGTVLIEAAPDVTDAIPTLPDVDDSGAMAAPLHPRATDLADLDALSAELDDALSIPQAIAEEPSLRRERRKYVRTIAEPPSEREPRTSLGRIAIRRVAVVSAKDERDTGNTLGEATRAIRRATDRDRIATLCVETLFRFAPSCAAASVLVVRGQVATTWKGFIRDGSPPPEIAVPLDQPGLIPKAVEQNSTVRSPAIDLSPIDQLVMVSLAQTRGELVVVPVSISKQVLCVIAIITESEAPIATAESVAAGAGAAFARLMRDASR